LPLSLLFTAQDLFGGVMITVLEPVTQYMYDNHMIEHHSTSVLGDKTPKSSGH